MLHLSNKCYAAMFAADQKTRDAAQEAYLRQDPLSGDPREDGCLGGYPSAPPEPRAPLTPVALAAMRRWADSAAEPRRSARHAMINRRQRG
jgi:hypothetical protein